MIFITLCNTKPSQELLVFVMAKEKSCSSSLLLLHLLFFSFNTHLSYEAHIIYPGQSLHFNQTIVSKGGTFELGFFTPGNSHNYYIGIWYTKATPRTVVWVANRETPISNSPSSELKLSKTHNLVLLNGSKNPVWSTNITSTTSNSTVAELLDSGNLILQGHDVIWQSFDHPTNCWLPGGRLGLNRPTGENVFITSWKSPDDPAMGDYSFGVNPTRDQLVQLYKGVQQYWTSGEWNGQYFSLVPELTRNQFYNFSYSNSSKYITYSILDPSIVTHFTVDVSGQGKMWWLKSATESILVWLQPRDQCDIYSYCGAFGVCSQNTLDSCACLRGFKPMSTREWGLGIWNGGCLRTSALHCAKNGSGGGGGDGFMLMPNVKLPVNPLFFNAGSIEDCKSACLSNCSCTGYAYGSGCSLWHGGLVNLQQVSDNSSGTGDLCIRLSAEELQSSKGDHKRINSGSLVGAIIGCVAMMILLVFLIWKLRFQWTQTTLELSKNSLSTFKYRDLEHVTKNFSERLGRGGFGSVYKGAFPDSTVVAVKKLEGFSQGEKQFRTEILAVGLIQHVNLLRLRGFCCQGSKRLLVYDYMPNGSLETHLFKNPSNRLDWKTRYQIMLGTARGLAYLHEGCRDCIIHCDIKPENILLDSEFHPKVADFGMSKLVGRDFSRVLTTMRGTIGYIAPEWISGLPITVKADVYSFGLMVFEMISGRRNSERCEDGKYLYYPLWVANKVREGDVLCLLDDRLDGIAEVGELTRACRVACWCIQDEEEDRPSMGRVVQLLEGVSVVDMPPVPSSLRRLVEQ